MKNLVFVGGLQYSGKTHVCKTLESRANDKYAHAGLDDSYDYLVHNHVVFLKLIEKYDKSLHIKIRYTGAKFGVFNESELIPVYATYMREQGKFQEFDSLVNFYSIMYLGEMLKKVKSEKTPVIDGVFINKFTRKLFYEVLRDSCEPEIHLDDAIKLFIYLDMGLDLSLQRLKTCDREEKKSMICTEERVRWTFEGQEIPRKDEWPNLEVLVINNKDEFGSAIDKAMKWNDFK